jgi:hypothetical protein
MDYAGVSSIFALRFGIDQSSAMTKAEAVTVPIDGFPTVDGDAVTMPFDGAIVGVALDTESGGSEGNELTAQPTIDGVEIAGVTTTVGDGKHAYASFDPSLYPVKAGEKVGAEIISNGSTGTPTPNETVVTVFVQVGQSQT